MKREHARMYVLAVLILIVGVVIGYWVARANADLLRIRPYEAQSDFAADWARDEGLLVRSDDLTVEELITTLHRYHRRFVVPLIHDSHSTNPIHTCVLQADSDSFWDADEPIFTETAGYKQDDHWHEMRGLGEAAARRLEITCQHAS